MLLTATIVLVTTVGAFLGFCFYVVYREHSIQSALARAEVVHSKTDRFIAFQKKFFLRGVSFATSALLALQTFLKKLFVFFFPSAKKAFEDKHLLTGLHHGPTSFFLDKVSSEKKQEKEKKSRTRKKI